MTQLGNRITIAAAGSGKTSGIVREAVETASTRSVLITYTNTNTAELREKTEEIVGYVPNNLTVNTWYSFLLRHFVRPYQLQLAGSPVREVQFVNGRSTQGISRDDIERFYFAKSGRMFLDKVSQFACVLIEKTEGKPLRRFEQIFDRIYIDEAQDLHGYDLDFVEHLLGTKVAVNLVGDTRQATYRTNNSGRNRKYGGARIIGKFEEWESSGMASIEYHAQSWRCIQSICDFADQFYPDFPPATSKNQDTTEHDGVFAVRESDVDEYMQVYRPQILRLRRGQECLPGKPLNYGEAKGRTFQRTLLFPHKGLLNVVKSGDPAKLSSSAETVAKVYVGITRARQSVGIMVPDKVVPKEIPVWKSVGTGGQMELFT